MLSKMFKMSFVFSFKFKPKNAVVSGGETEFPQMFTNIRSLNVPTHNEKIG